jgi:5-enolpyruvylshikimate-3-phosphate synthase
MAFSLVGARVPVELQDADVVAKTCPEFFSLWRATGAIVDKAAAG